MYIHVCVVTFLGGTNFGFMNGANIEEGEYRPDVTSYGKPYFDYYMYTMCKCK